MCIPKLVSSTPRMVAPAALRCAPQTISGRSKVVVMPLLRPLLPLQISSFGTFRSRVSVTGGRELGRGGGVSNDGGIPHHHYRSCPALTYLGIVFAFSTIVMLNLQAEIEDRKKKGLS